MEHSMLFAAAILAGDEDNARTDKRTRIHKHQECSVRCKDGTVFKLDGSVSPQTACELHDGVDELIEA